MELENKEDVKRFIQEGISKIKQSCERDQDQDDMLANLHEQLCENPSESYERVSKGSLIPS